MKNIIYLLVLFCLFSCSKETKSDPMLNDGQITLSLDLIREFSLQLDNSSSKSLLLEDSDFVHVYDNEITVNFTSVPPGYSESLTFNPNDNTQRVTLPYGEYNWEIPSEDNPSPISNTLSISGQSTSVITINEPSVDLTLSVNTDYALVTVNDDYTSNVTLTHEDLSLSMNIKDGYNYGYVLSGTTSSSISVMDTNGDNYTDDLGLIQSCKHYKYQLDYSEVGVSSLICVCDPFEVIERYFSLCSGSSSLINDSKLWLTFDNNLNDQSTYGNTVTNYGTTFSSNRNNINNSSLLLNGQNYLIVDENSSLETIELSVSVWVKPSSLGVSVPWNTILKKGTYSQASSETFWLGLNDSQNGNGEVQVGYKNNTCDTGQGWNKFIETSNTPLINNWTHIVITHDSNNNQSIYINGSLFSSEVVEGNLSICPGGQISIGSEWSQNISGFIGSIDDLGLWDKVLSPCQVEWLYEN